MKPQKLRILDYANNVVHRYLVAPDVEVDAIYVSNLGFSDSNIEWMVGDFEVLEHKGILL